MVVAVVVMGSECVRLLVFGLGQEGTTNDSETPPCC